MAPNTKFDKSVAVPHDASFDPGTLEGKSVIVTGGASGIGEAAMRGFVKAGAFVTFGDLAEDRGKALVSELGEDNVAFIRCDVLSWNDQLTLFKTALSKSPSKTIDVVFANAGLNRRDDIVEHEAVTDDGDPVEPDLTILKTNLLGVLLTTKLANFYFIKQPEGDDRDRCLIVTASLSGYIDHPGAPQYNTSKWGIRGLMRSLRRTGPSKGIRINIIAPWFVHTRIMTDEVAHLIKDAGYDFAEIDDAASAVLHIASEKAMNGRSFCIAQKSISKRGYYDLEADDWNDDNSIKIWNDLSFDLLSKVRRPDRSH